MSEIKPALTETWLPVVGYETLYEVSSIGRVRSTHPTRGKMLKLAPDRGYMRATLSRHGASRMTDRQRAAIRREHGGGLSIARLAAVTGMSERAITRIVRRLEYV
jgi:AraC-like DNA-binding protein